jgi:hypothetical protein
MSQYLFIESRDPFESADTDFCRDVASRLAAQAHRVALFLVQNGVLPARAGSRHSGFSELARAGVELLADDFSLRERAITKLQPEVRPAPIDLVVDRMAEGWKVIWH